jgi:hypothetical protein
MAKYKYITSTYTWKNYNFNVDVFINFGLRVAMSRYIKKCVKVHIIQFFIVNVPSQQLQRQLQTQHNVDIGNSIKDRHKIDKIYRIIIIQFNDAMKLKIMPIYLNSMCV